MIALYDTLPHIESFAALKIEWLSGWENRTYWGMVREIEHLLEYEKEAKEEREQAGRRGRGNRRRRRGRGRGQGQT